MDAYAEWEKELMEMATPSQEQILKSRLTNYTSSTMESFPNFIDYINGDLTPGQRILWASGVQDYDSVVEDEWMDIDFRRDDERWATDAAEFDVIEERMWYESNGYDF